MRIILTIFAGRERYLSILSTYLNILLDKGVLNEVHLWNYARNEQDYAYVQKLSEIRTEYKIFNPNKDDIHKGWNQWSAYYEYYTTQNDYDENDIIIKCDDDIVYIDVDKFMRYIRSIKHGSIYFPNIVNNDVGAYVQTQNKVHRLLILINNNLLKPGCDIPLSTMDGRAWCDKPEKAQAVHATFLQRRERFSLELPLIPWTSRVSINFFGMTFRTMKRNYMLFKEFGGGDDEAFLSARIMNHVDSPNYIVPFFNVVHFSFGGQYSKGLDDQFLPHYRGLAEQIESHFLGSGV